MSIYHIGLSKIDLENDFYNSNLNEEVLRNFHLIDNEYEERAETLLKSNSLKKFSVSELVSFFDSFINSNFSFIQKFSKLGITFLINFLKKNNLLQLLHANFYGNIEFLDKFCLFPELDKYLKASPRGIVTHWLAGNVPVLGMISLVQGILTKNINIIKLPKENGLILPTMIKEMLAHSIEMNGKSISGEEIFNNILFIYCDKNDIEAQTKISKVSDVRVAWGGKEAVESVLKYPKKYWAQDIIFGPKYSFAVIGKNSFKKEELSSITYKLALDASVFEQKGCNSPHTVFVEKGGEISPLEFARALSKGMENVLKRIPKDKITAEEAYNIVSIRAEYEFIGEVFSSKGTEWSVIYSEENELASPCYNRTLFVRPVDSIYDTLKFIDHNIQTLGISIDEKRKIDFSTKATEKGVERITDLGKMSIYEHPWDGIFPMERLVRWSSLTK